MMDIEQKFKEIAKELYNRFGTDSYEIRCKLHDLSTYISSTSSIKVYIPKCDKCQDKYWIYEEDGTRYGCSCHN